MDRLARLSPKAIFAEMRQALATRTGKSTQWVFVGEMASAVMGFLVSVLLLRKMPIEDYGLFSLFLSTMMLLSGFMHLGWIETYVRFGSRYRGGPDFEPVRTYSFKSALWGMLGITALVALTAPWISTQIFKRDHFSVYVQIAALGAVINCLFSFVQNDYRVSQNTRAYVSGRVGPSAARLGLGIAAVFLGMVTLQVVSGIYLISSILFILWPLLLLAKNWSRQPLNPEIKNEMSAYNRWIFVSYLTTTVIGNIDSQVLAHFHDNQTLSAFSAAGRLTLPILMVVTSLTTTLLPRLSAYQHASEMRAYLRKMSLFVAPLALLVLIACWIAPPVLIWIAGDKYSGITVLLRLQILTALVMLVSNPAGLILNAWGWSRLLAILNIAQLIVDLALDLLWIPPWGAVGAVLATLVINLMGMVTIYAAIWYGLRDKGAAPARS